MPESWLEFHRATLPLKCDRSTQQVQPSAPEIRRCPSEIWAGLYAQRGAVLSFCGLTIRHGFGWLGLASRESLMSSLSGRATRLAVPLATLAVLLSTALPVSAAGRFSRLKPGVQLHRWRCARNRADRQSGQVPRRLGGTGQRHPQHPAPGCARASWRPAAQPCSRTAPPFRGEPPAMVPLVTPTPRPSRPACPVTGSRSTRARHGRDDESQELSGGGESHVS